MNLLKRKKGKLKPESKYELLKIYTDKDGRDWFEFAEKMNVPAKRAIAAEVATRFADMNLTKTKLKELIGRMKDHAENGKIVDLFAIVSEIEFRLDFIGEEETLIEFASIYFLLPGEPADDVSEMWTQKKKELLKNDSAARAFFLSRAYLIITNYSQLSGKDFEKYLTATKEHAERLSRFLSVKSSAVTSKI